MNSHRKHPISARRNNTHHLSARKLAARLWHLHFFKLSSSHKLDSSPPRDSRKPVVSELLRAQTCINKLKAEHKFSKKKLLEDEKLLWKDKLARERMESLNAKLVHELAEAKLYAKQFMINYKEEKRKRETIEQVCNELAMQIEQDRAKMEEERNMFHIAEMLREESIQMKLLDAKLVLEDKYNQMIHLIAHLQSFLRTTESVSVESNDVFDIFYELRINGAECCDSVALVQRISEDSKSGKCKRGLGESTGFRQANSAKSVNPHITRGMKGCIEWPRGISKINSKVIPLEERVRKQKSQLQHILRSQAALR